MSRNIFWVGFVKNCSHGFSVEPTSLFLNSDLLVSAKFCEQVQSLRFTRTMVWETQQFSRLGSVKSRSHLLHFTWTQICLLRPSEMSNCSRFILLELDLWDVAILSTKICEKLQSLHFTWTLICLFRPSFVKQLQSLHFTCSLNCETQQFSRLRFVNNPDLFVSTKFCEQPQSSPFSRTLICERNNSRGLDLWKIAVTSHYLNPYLFV